MSAVVVPPPVQSSPPPPVKPRFAQRWIVSWWVDATFILLTPFLATPAILILYSSWVGVRAETIGLIVAAFFATGHHLPGLIRAYGDRELFSRFRWRFLFAPPLVFLAYFPLASFHFDLYRLIILFWATWHGLMQLYGFVRIYDAKVGSVSKATAYWDWLICLCGFIMPQLLRPEITSKFLRHWYSLGGPMITLETLNAIRWTGIAVSGVVVLGFCFNYGMQLYRGPKPNPLKLLMLASGIGIWWFSMLYVDNLILGVALFDVCHDVQYLAIVWLFNSRRVSQNSQLSSFMRFVFRRGMVLLYLGLITAYGAIGLVASQALDGTISSIAYAVLFTSTILHYYYDGFIWKMRETSNQISLGLSQDDETSRSRQIRKREMLHLLKCAPVLAVLGLMFTADLVEPPLTTGQKNSLDKLYGQSLMGRSALPSGEEERSWLYSQFEQSQNIAAAVPEDQSAQLQAAIMLANFGRNPEAIERLELLVTEHPEYYDANFVLGGVYHYQGNFDRAAECFRLALSQSKTSEERSRANLKWGEVDLERKDIAAAEEKFKVAVQEDPSAAEAIEEVRKRFRSDSAAP